MDELKKYAPIATIIGTIIAGVACLVAIIALIPAFGLYSREPAPPTVRQSAPEQPTTSNSDSGFIQATCDWGTDWERQSNGSYLWVGLPPGTSGCQNVGQAGELLQRLGDGENITLVLEVGDTPLGLDICSGSYKATQVIPGQTCASDNPEVWPKVSGTLTVIESTGFLVGTGK